MCVQDNDVVFAFVYLQSLRDVCRLGLRSAHEPTQSLGINAGWVRGVAQNSPRGPGINIMGHTVPAGKGNTRGTWIHTVWLIFKSGADQLATRDI